MDEPKRILVVDDEDMNRKLLKIALTRLDYEVDEAFDGVDALEKVNAGSPDLILLDINMPRMGGLEFARRIRQNAETNSIPIVIVSSLDEVENRVKALEAGADDFLSKPVELTELRARVKTLLKIKAYNDHMHRYQKELETEVAKRTDQLKQAFEELKVASQKIKQASLDTIFRLSQAAEYKDEDTGNHIKRMGYYIAALGRQLKLSEQEIEILLYASPMHDVGKIGIPDRILLKPGKLDANEWEIMKQHSLMGGKILKGSDSEILKTAELIALTHHEKWDGSGYPNALKGEEIPLAGRITAIADVFDALTSTRPYKKAFSLEESFAIILEGRGKSFAPELVDAFFAIKDEIIAIRQSYSHEDPTPFIFDTFFTLKSSAGS